MLIVVNDNHVASAASLSEVEDTFRVADTNAAVSTRVVDVEIIRRTFSLSAAEYKSRYADTLKARQILCNVLGQQESIYFL